MERKTALIIGAGPAGLTAAYELLDRTDVLPIVVEATGDIGGISRTVCHRGNRMDIGGHRFFSKSDRVMQWWLNILPRQGAPARDDLELGRAVEQATTVRQRPLRSPMAITRPAPNPEREDRVMLARSRLSRILFLRKFFDYPITLSRRTVANLGWRRMARIGASYIHARLFLPRPVVTLEDFFIRQFGRELYETFFRDYTAKVWGRPCREIPADWGAQRVKGLSLSKAVGHALQRLTRRTPDGDQKGVETSLIESFLYPKFGPGQLWETVAAQVREQGGQLYLHTQAEKLLTAGKRVTGLKVIDTRSGERRMIAADYVLSSMPIRDLVAGFAEPPPDAVRRTATALPYRDFITVGVLARRLRLANDTTRPTLNGLVPDNWIYIQEPDVRVGRLQIFNNWSPYLVADPDTVWLGMEYFCNEGDALWRQPDDAFARLAVAELAQIGVADAADVLDTVVIRVPKAYPAYFDAYADFAVVREYLDRFTNLFLIGRNGMHRYNNQDHSMLTAMVAVDNIRDGASDKADLWAVNAEEEFHESK